MKPIRFKVDEVKETPQGWVIVAHAMQAGYFQSGPTARLAGCRVQELPAAAGAAPTDPPHEVRRVFLLKDQADHDRFIVGQKMLLDP
jgi:hypothetical protein